MRSTHVSIEEASAHFQSIRSIWLSRVPTVALWIFAIVTCVAVFIPLNPRMPSRGLDAAWEFAMNEAVARHMTFGKQIVFTYGPYAAVSTRTYHPATDRRMILGSLFVAGSYLIALNFLAGRERRYLVVVLLLFLATFGNPELILLSYAFLASICVLKWLSSEVQQSRATTRWWQIFAFTLMWSTLGMLPLVKGSLLLPFAAAVAVPAAFALSRARLKSTAVLIMIPLSAMVALWMIADQPIANLPAFFRGTMWLTSGYTEAMSTSWLILPGAIGAALVATYLGLSVALYFTVGRVQRMSVASRVAVATLCSAFLFVIFKHAFVKADALPGAFCSLAVLMMIVGFVNLNRHLVWSLVVSVILAAGISVMQDAVLVQAVHQKFGRGVTWDGGRRDDILAFCLRNAAGAYSRTTYKNTWVTYTGAWQGLLSRLEPGNVLDDRYRNAIASIKASYALPPLNGSVDLYTFDQSVLLASANEWNPRPVLQSYSVYTPELEKLDEQHLRNSDAPDWVLFDLQTIDGRLPSLDDGASWPALLDNYKAISYDGEFLLMQRKESIRTRSTYELLFKGTCRVGDSVAIPPSNGLLFAQLELQPTLIGRLAIALFNPPQLHMVIDLGQGKTEKYRVISNVMNSDFLLSPVVNTTQEFASLSTSNRAPEVGRIAQSISIAPSYGGSIFWSSTYQLTLKKYSNQ